MRLRRGSRAGGGKAGKGRWGGRARSREKSAYQWEAPAYRARDAEVPLTRLPPSGGRVRKEITREGASGEENAGGRKKGPDRKRAVRV